jgi:hypothetical protein
MQKSHTRQPFATSSVMALALALIAVGLAIFGTTPYAGALNFPHRPLQGTQATLVYGGTFLLPIALGFAAAFFAYRGLQAADRSEGRLRGWGLSIFAIFIGLFAVALGAISTFAGLIYPRM